MRKSFIETGHPQLSVRRQSRLLEVNRNRLTQAARKTTPEEMALCLEIDKLYPYLLRDLEIERPNQVWCSYITYIPMKRGFAYLVVIMDWHSRAVLGWKISNTIWTQTFAWKPSRAPVRSQAHGQRS